MVGRATFGCPWIFQEMRVVLDGRPADPTLTTDRKIDLLLEQLHINVERIDEYRGILHTRRHIAASPVPKAFGHTAKIQQKTAKNRSHNIFSLKPGQAHFAVHHNVRQYFIIRRIFDFFTRPWSSAQKKDGRRPVREAPVVGGLSQIEIISREAAAREQG